MKLIAFPCIAALCLSATLVSAFEGVLLATDGADQVHVWKDRRAHESAENLAALDMTSSNPELLVELTECSVEPGTKALRRLSDSFVTEVLIIEGDDTGCVGVVATENFQVK